jgi:hypothetical protein
MPPKNNMNKETTEACRRMMRDRRNSPDDLIQRRLILRPNGEQLWQPPIPDDSSLTHKLPAPSEIWVRFSEPNPASHAGVINPPITWDFAGWAQTAKTCWADRKITVYFVSFDPVSIKGDVFSRLQILADLGVSWSTRLLTDGKNIMSTAILDQILRSSLQEIEVYVAGLGEPSVSNRVLDAVKDLCDLRRARKQEHPIITCRLCPVPPMARR